MPNCKIFGEYLRGSRNILPRNKMQRNLSNNSRTTVGSQWEDVNWGSNGESNNNFIQSILWGAKWSNLPNNELTWMINYNGEQNSINYADQGNMIDLIEPTEEVKNLVETCMTDLGKIINLNIRKTTDINDAILSFNFVDNTNSSVNWLGVAVPPSNSSDTYYNTDKDYVLLTDSFWVAGNIYIGYNNNINDAYHFQQLNN